MLCSNQHNSGGYHSSRAGTQQRQQQHWQASGAGLITGVQKAKAVCAGGAAAAQHLRRPQICHRRPQVCRQQHVAAGAQGGGTGAGEAKRPTEQAVLRNIVLARTPAFFAAPSPGLQLAVHDALRVQVGERFCHVDRHLGAPAADEEAFRMAVIGWLVDT